MGVNGCGHCMRSGKKIGKEFRAKPFHARPVGRAAAWTVKRQEAGGSGREAGAQRRVCTPMAMVWQVPVARS